MTAGVSVMRTRKASITMPTASPRAIGLSDASPSGTKAANTENMMSAAAVTTRAEEVKPDFTAPSAIERASAGVAPCLRECT